MTREKKVKKMNGSTEKVLKDMKELLEFYLEELNGREANAFCYGEKTAYVECLEMIQKWHRSKEIGLDYEIEKKYPL